MKGSFMCGQLCFMRVRGQGIWQCLQQTTQEQWGTGAWAPGGQPSALRMATHQRWIVRAACERVMPAGFSHADLALRSSAEPPMLEAGWGAAVLAAAARLTALLLVLDRRGALGTSSGLSVAEAAGTRLGGSSEGRLRLSSMDGLTTSCFAWWRWSR